MATIEIQDEQLAQRLQSIAEAENRSLESLLRRFAADYPVNPMPPVRSKEEKEEEIRWVRAKWYAKARRYWESVGETEKAALTDDYLDEHFGAFDEEGIPRFKSEITTEPPVGSLAYAAKVIEEMGGVQIEGYFDSSKADDILNDEFADYLLARMKRNSGD
jgi:hypothetical protein